MELIDRQAAIKIVQAYHCRYPEYMDGFVSNVLSAIKADLVEDIEELPTAEPKTGKWISHVIGREHIPWGFDCSNCGNWLVIREETAEKYNFCPNCGAKMEG